MMHVQRNKSSSTRDELGGTTYLENKSAWIYHIIKHQDKKVISRRAILLL